MGFWLLRPGVVFGGLLTTLAHFSDRGRRFGFLLGLMATFVIWTWSRALWARTLMVVARRLGRLVRCRWGVERASVSRNQQRERLLPPRDVRFTKPREAARMRYTTPRVARGACFAGLALSALRLLSRPGLRRSALHGESVVYGASMESCVRLAENSS